MAKEIWENVDKLCLRCMKLIDDPTGVCPQCGHDRQAYLDEQKPWHLSPMRILKGRYLIGTVIGEGGFGITYSAFDLATNRHVAVKELFLNGFVQRSGDDVQLIVDPKASNEDIEAKRRYYDECQRKFLQEANALQRLEDKSGIVAIFDYFQENQTAYIVMEYLEGSDLLGYLKEHDDRVSFNEAIRLLRPVMKSMMSVHKLGIIHRDISPDNIKANKLMDFGSARFTESSGNSKLVLVKNGYAPPEQYAHNYMVGQWMDVYAMAATIYRCIVGSVPKSAQKRASDDDLEKPSQAGVEIPPAAEKILMKAMALKPQDRYPNMAEFYFALRDAAPAAFDKGAVTEHPPDGLPPQVPPREDGTQTRFTGGQEPVSNPVQLTRRNLIEKLNSNRSDVGKWMVFIAGIIMDGTIVAILLRMLTTRG